MTIIKHRSGDDLDWSNVNPILDDGEIGFERNTGKFKIGDGITAWDGLEYFLPESAVSPATPNHFSAYSDVDQTIPQQIFTTLALSNVVVDNVNGWDPLSNEYEIQSDGLYLTVARVRAADMSPPGAMYGIAVNTVTAGGSFFVWGSVADTLNVQNRTTHTASRVVQYSAGDRPRLVVYADNADPSLDFKFAEMSITRLGST